MIEKKKERNVKAEMDIHSLRPFAVQKDWWPFRRKDGRRICRRSWIWRWSQSDQSAVNNLYKMIK